MSPKADFLLTLTAQGERPLDLHLDYTAGAGTGSARTLELNGLVSEGGSSSW